MWCVECVVRGSLEVTQYELLERKDDLYRFAERSTVRAEVGDAGCLIPPYEYHVLQNADADRRAVTLHVYAGEMTRCNRFLPANDGWWTRTESPLAYDD
jgi:hypothetical protein